MRKEKGGKRGKKKMDERQEEREKESGEVEERIEERTEDSTEEGTQETEERLELNEEACEEERCEEDSKSHLAAKRARVCATFTDSQETAIVEFVKEHPELYDKEHARFHDRQKKEALWAEISAELKLQRTRYGKLSKLQSGQAPRNYVTSSNDTIEFTIPSDLFLETLFLCQLTCQSADIMSSLCGVGVRVRVRVRVRVNNFSSKTTRPRDVLFFLKDTLSIEDEKLFKACKSVCSSVC